LSQGLYPKEEIMSLFTVDQEKCRRDGICVAECPGGIIEVKEEGGIPIPAESARDLCIHCGHCVAVCPQGALSLETMNPHDCPSLENGLSVPAESVEYLIRTRRSVRTYKNRPVERNTLKRLIDTARNAPSIKNLQPVHWLVIEQRSEVHRLASLVVAWMKSMVESKQKARYPLPALGHIIEKWEKGDDLVCHGAPHLIVVHGPKDSRASLTSCIIALTTLELAAHSFGLGTCWAGYFYAAANFYPPMLETLDLPGNHQCFAAMMIGYPKYRYHRIPVKREASITWR
jgi:nitroreductase/NAD-dependent dihydropyrimidine dehydrogenase PreA subunit